MIGKVSKMNTPDKRRIFCVDENPLLRDGISYAIDKQPDLVIVGEASSGEQAITLYPSLRPDLTIIDLGISGAVSGVETIRTIRRPFPYSRFLLLMTYATDLDVGCASAASAEGYLSKDFLRTELIPAVRTILDGGRVVPFEIGSQLSSLMGVNILAEREIEILRLLGQGQSMAAAARLLNISDDLVAAHVRNVLQRLHATSIEQALTIARNRGHLEAPRR